MVWYNPFSYFDKRYGRDREMNFAQNSGEFFSSPKAVKRTIIKEEHYKQANRLKSAFKIGFYTAGIATIVYLLTSCSSLDISNSYLETKKDNINLNKPSLELILK